MPRNIGLLIPLTVVGCGKGDGKAAGAVGTAAPSDLRTTLEDETGTVHGRPGWSTYWKFCWDSVPGALGYELQTVTSEGTSPRVRQQSDACFRLQVAAGISRGARRTVERGQQLAWQSANLAYRVRAHLHNGVGAWSPPVSVGVIPELHGRQRVGRLDGPRNVVRDRTSTVGER